MNDLEADDYQSERELLQPRSYNTFDYNNRSQKKKKGNWPHFYYHYILNRFVLESEKAREKRIINEIEYKILWIIN